MSSVTESWDAHMANRFNGVEKGDTLPYHAFEAAYDSIRAPLIMTAERDGVHVPVSISWPESTDPRVRVYDESHSFRRDRRRM